MLCWTKAGCFLFSFKRSLLNGSVVQFPNFNINHNQIKTSWKFWHRHSIFHRRAYSDQSVIYVEHSLPHLAHILIQSSAFPFQLSQALCARGLLGGGGRFPLLVVIRMSWSTYSANQESRFETRVPSGASSWSRFTKKRKGPLTYNSSKALNTCYAC